MVVAPPETPVTTPLVPSMVATDVVVLVQVPPGVASLSVVVEPAQIVVIPVIGAVALTVTTCSAGQLAAM